MTPTRESQHGASGGGSDGEELGPGGGGTSLPRVRLTIGGVHLTALLEERAAPATCAAFRQLLPLRTRIIHARWSGEAMWMPFGEQRVAVDYENATSHPSPGEILLYPGGISEMEILIPYGACLFASKVGQLAGNHFATVLDGRERLRALGEHVLWQGALDVLIEVLPAGGSSERP